MAEQVDTEQVDDNSYDILTGWNSPKELTGSPMLLLELLLASVPSPAELWDTNWWSEVRDRLQAKSQRCVFSSLLLTHEYFPN